MQKNWPSEESRERFIKFLELELRIMQCASRKEKDISTIREFNELLEEHFPKTKIYLEGKSPDDIAEIFSGALRLIAWAEARAVETEDGTSKVDGIWSKDDIERDINECFSEARKRVGL